MRVNVVLAVEIECLATAADDSGGRQPVRSP